MPALGEYRLDEIGPAQIESYKAKKAKEGLSKKTINNHLTVLRKLSPDARRNAVKLLDIKEAVTLVWRTSKGEAARFPLGGRAAVRPRVAA